MAITYLTRTMSTNSNQKKFTISVWLKRGSLGRQVIMGVGGSANYATEVYFTSSDVIDFWNYFNGSYAGRKTTNRVFKDTNGWYHLVIAVDTTSGTASQRMRIYINGVEETSFSNNSNPNQDQTYEFNSASVHEIGRNGNSSYCFDGQMSHFHFVDGSQLTPSVFGETDSTTGEWKIKTSPDSYTLGSNGFSIMKDGNTITDQSSNSNDFTLGAGTLVNYPDNPSNIFCSLNNRMEIPGSTVYNASSEVSNTNGSHKTIYGSIPFTSGKYYWEAKAKSGSAVKHTIGLSDVRNSYNYRQNSSANTLLANSGNSYGRGDAIGYYYSTIYKNGSTVVSSIHQIANNDIMMVACDADNGKIYFGVNGTWRVANSTTFNSAQHDTTFTTGRFYLPAFSNENCGWFTNFGNGYFGATAISSAGTNASGIGTFEYDVPTGFTALCTKGLNE